MEDQLKPQYQSTSTLVKTMTICFILNAIIALVSVPLKTISAFGPGAPDIAKIKDLIFLTLIVLFSIRIYRANLNARALGAQGMRFSPGWTVGWFFVPVMNLFRPFQAVREVWKASDPNAPERWDQKETSHLLKIW